MTGLGHNKGPTMEKGRGWRRYAWRRARAELLPKMPIEIVRRRVRRARELGLDYKSYAGIRAATGRDVIALLFSDNALRLMKDGRMPPARAETVGAIRKADVMAMVHAPHDPARVIRLNGDLHRVTRAPAFTARWRDIRADVLTLIDGLPGDGVVVVGETWLEREWCEAARLAGYVPSETYFASLANS